VTDGITFKACDCGADAIERAEHAEADVQRLTKERDQARWDYRQTGDEANQWHHVADVRANMLRYIAFVTCGDENGDAQLGVDRMKAENERLTAALKEMIKRHGPLATEATALRAERDAWKLNDEMHIRRAEKAESENRQLTEALKMAREALQAALTLPRPHGDYGGATWAQWEAVVEQIEAALGQLHS